MTEILRELLEVIGYAVMVLLWALAIVAGAIVFTILWERLGIW